MNWPISWHNWFAKMKGAVSHIAAPRSFCLAITLFVGAQTTSAQSGTIQLSELPKPPAEIAQLLKVARVEFTYGPMREPALPSLPDSRLAQAVTDYQLSYKYKTFTKRASSRIRQSTGSSINPNSVALTSKHVVWFRDRPELETFWTNWLVLHELDHVRISSDPRLESRFKELLAEGPGTEAAAIVLESTAPQDSAKAQAEEVFQKVVSLIDIRYKELDRLTDHGSLALPKDSSLEFLLRPIEPEINDK